MTIRDFIMGHITSRQRPRSEDESAFSRRAYCYPANCGGLYFGSHFLFGGERFSVAPPETFLFGDNYDLNFLGAKPMQLSHPHCSVNEPVRPLQCSVAVRRDSLKFVRVENIENEVHCESKSEVEPSGPKYNMEFIFDCDSPCTITIFYFAEERCDGNIVTYVSSRPDLTSCSYHYKPGAGQIFRQHDSVFEPGLYITDELLYNTVNETVPIVIHCVSTNERRDGSSSQCHSVLAYVERSSDGSGYVLKALKQKHFVDGVSYLMQEIYGIENKRCDNTQDDTSPSQDRSSSSTTTHDACENSGECIVCMSEWRDTLILPCRHLCVCSACAETLRYKTSNCPVCRSPFRALLQLKTIRKSTYWCSESPTALTKPSTVDRLPLVNSRFEMVPLVEALNGPSDTAATTTFTVTSRIPSCSSRRTASAAVGCIAVAHTTATHANRGTACVSGGHSTPLQLQPGATPHHQHRVGVGQRPANRRNHRRKKHTKPVVPIQVVLTPQSLNAKTNEMIELPVRRSYLSREFASSSTKPRIHASNRHAAEGSCVVSVKAMDNDVTVVSTDNDMHRKTSDGDRKLSPVVEEPCSSITLSFGDNEPDVDATDAESDDDDGGDGRFSAAESDADAAAASSFDARRLADDGNQPVAMAAASGADDTVTSSISTASSASSKPLLTVHDAVNI